MPTGSNLHYSALFFTSFGDLRTFCLMAIETAFVTGLKSIARCTELRLLKLGYCMDITDAGLVHIGATCKNLREFDCYRFVLPWGRD